MTCDECGAELEVTTWLSGNWRAEISHGVNMWSGAGLTVTDALTNLASVLAAGLADAHHYMERS